MVESGSSFWRFRGRFVVRRQNALFWNEILPVLNILHLLHLSHLLSVSFLFLLHQKLTDQRLILVKSNLFRGSEHHGWLALLYHIAAFALRFRFTVMFWLRISLQVALIICRWHYQEFIHNHVLNLSLGEFTGYFLIDHKLNTIMQLFSGFESEFSALLHSSCHLWYTVCFWMLVWTLLPFEDFTLDFI